MTKPDINKIKFLICPHCTESLTYNAISQGYAEGDYYYEPITATCTKCGARYQWRETYLFKGISSVEEITKT